MNELKKGIKDAVQGTNGKIDTVSFEKVVKVVRDLKELLVVWIKCLMIQSQDTVPSFMNVIKERRARKIPLSTKVDVKLPDKRHVHTTIFKALFLDKITENDNHYSKGIDNEFCDWQVDHRTHVVHDLNFESPFPSDANTNSTNNNIVFSKREWNTTRTCCEPMTCCNHRSYPGCSSCLIPGNMFYEKK